MELTKQEKTDIINQHQRNLVYNKYNTELSIVEENAKTSPDAEVIATLNAKINELTSQLNALKSELDSL